MVCGISLESVFDKKFILLYAGVNWWGPNFRLPRGLHSNEMCPQNNLNESYNVLSLQIIEYFDFNFHIKKVLRRPPLRPIGGHFDSRLLSPIKGYTYK